MNRFVTFNRSTNSPVANYKGELYSLPFYMYTFNKIWGVVTPEEATEKVAEQRKEIERVIYTGPIDAYFNYNLGNLEYRSVKFETEVLDVANFRGNAAVKYTDRETPWTRIIEHKWFEFGKDENGNDLPKTVISREYSSEWKPGDEPY